MLVSRDFLALMGVVAPTVLVLGLLRMLSDTKAYHANVTRADAMMWSREITFLLEENKFKVERPVSIIRGDLLDLTDYGRKVLNQMAPIRNET